MACLAVVCGPWTGKKTSLLSTGYLSFKPLLIHLLLLIEKVEVELGHLEGTEITVGVYAGGEFDVVFHNRNQLVPRPCDRTGFINEVEKFTRAGSFCVKPVTSVLYVWFEGGLSHPAEKIDDFLCWEDELQEGRN